GLRRISRSRAALRFDRPRARASEPDRLSHLLEGLWPGRPARGLRDRAARAHRPDEPRAPALQRELGRAGRGDRRARRPRVPAAQLRDEPRRTAAAAGRLRADGPGVRAVVRELRPVPRRRCAGRLRVATARRRHRAPGGELRAARVAARLGRAARGERGLPARAGAGAGGLVTQRKVAILGVGLIGASLAAALSRAKQGWHLAGYSPGDDAQVARALGYLDTACRSEEHTSEL